MVKTSPVLRQTQINLGAGARLDPSVWDMETAQTLETCARFGFLGTFFDGEWQAIPSRWTPSPLSSRM